MFPVHLLSEYRQEEPSDSLSVNYVRLPAAIVDRDYQQVAKCFRKAAEQRNDKAQQVWEFSTQKVKNLS